jgi:hypothetical protein
MLGAKPAKPAQQEAFAALKRTLQKHARRLHVTSDHPGNYYLETNAASFRGKRMFFGSVQIKKTYVSFHLMPVYTHPQLLDAISPELRARMQGKSCFNFNAPDPALFAELEKLTAEGLKRYAEEGLL